VKAVQLKWKDLHFSLHGTKIHAIFAHLVQLMTEWFGIGCLGEDFNGKGAPNRKEG